jgi:6-phosphofructokinase 1
MVTIIRDPNAKNYQVSYQLINVEESANAEKHVPLEWIKPDRSGMTQEFYDYALPLIQGEANPPKENSLPRFAHLKKIYASKK